MRRRAFLAALPAVALAGCDRFSFEDGLLNPCLRGENLLAQPQVARAWEGLRADRVWDVHAHLYGNGRTKTGIWVDPGLDKPGGPIDYVRHTFFMNGGCVGENEERIDEGMVARLVHLANEYPQGAKLMLLAFDFTYDESGKRREDLTTFHVPNAYARSIARTHPRRFEWIASVHPCRPDARKALEAAKQGGARAVKWLPPAMGIDLMAKQSLAFYDALKRLDLPLLVHVGEEQAVPGAHRPELANPLHLRAPLDLGVRVIAAHCASMGESLDLDANPNPDKAPKAESFELFARLMGERRYEGLLFGDISAVTQLNRARYVPKILGRRDWHPRLLNGSDYPLPGIMPLYSLDAFVRQGILDEREVPALRELRKVNALLFDLVLKRSLRKGDARFPASVFESREFFDAQEPGTDPMRENRGPSPA